MEEKKSEFGEDELGRLKEGLKRSYKERFEMATHLFKIEKTMAKATVTHKPFISK
jgi:hypothetical protein